MKNKASSQGGGGVCTPNLVPRAFPFMKLGGAGKGPGIGRSRVHLTPWNPGCNKLRFDKRVK